MARLRFLALAGLILATASCRPDDPGQRDATVARGDSVPTDARVQRADRARVAGSADAPVWIVEISDFQCPYCRVWQQETYPALRREYVDNGRVRFAYINLPLPHHRHARPSAEAALCAGEQERFWEMHNAIFATQQRWTPLDDAAQVLDSIARELPIDHGRWSDCVREGTMRDLVQADYDRSVQSGVNSTPSFLVFPAGHTGEPIVLVGAQPIESFRRVIDALLPADRR